MKGLDWHSMLAGIIVVLIVVLISSLLINPVAGFDIKKFFGLEPILGQEGEFKLEPPKVIRTFYGKDIGVWCPADPNEIQKSGKFGELSSVICGSPTCPGLKAISCAVEGDNSDMEWKRDALVDVYIENNKCIVHARDDADMGNSVKKFVKVFCSSEDVTISEGQWEISDLDIASFTGNNNNCPTDYPYPIFCSTESKVDEEKYQDDVIKDFMQNPFTANPQGCYVEVQDKITDNEHQRKVSPSCSKTLYSWYFSDAMGDPDMMNLWDTYQTLCPGDMVMLSCLVDGDRDNYISTLTPLIDDFGRNLCKAVLKDSHSTTLSALCAENLWKWSSWYKNTDKLPVMTSPVCPDGKMAISCATQVADLEWWDGYGEDMINTIFLIDSNGDSVLDQCKVVPRDMEGSNEHKRAVGVLCAKNLPDDFKEAGWTNWFTRTQAIQTNDKGAKFNSLDCPTGFKPISCMVQTDYPGGEDTYGEDGILSITVDDSKCTITMGDSSGAAEFYLRFNAMCAKNEYVTRRDVTTDYWHTSTDADAVKFNSTPCSFGVATFPLTETNFADTKYLEDLIVALVPINDWTKIPLTPNSFLIQAWDWDEGMYVGDWKSAGNEHTRRNGIICLDYEGGFI